MKASQFEFRFRIWFAVAFYALGFWAPWLRYGPFAGATANSTAWLALSTSLARWHWLPLEQATLLVTSLAIVFAFAGAAIRVCGTSCLGTSIVHAGAMQAGQVMAGGPYRHVRNPLYLGTWLFALGVSIIMPPSGAIFFLVVIAIFYFRLILGEEDFLARKLGAPYLEYKRRVPRLLPSLRPSVVSPGIRPQWLQGLLAESFPVGFAVCLAVLAWRYQPELLVRCLLVCFGLSLVARALLPKQQVAAQSAEPGA